MFRKEIYFSGPDGGITRRETSRMVGGVGEALQKPTMLSKQMRHQCNHANALMKVQRARLIHNVFTPNHI